MTAPSVAPMKANATALAGGPAGMVPFLEVLLVLELVIEGTPGVASFACHLLEGQVGVSATRQTARSGFQQGAPRPSAAIGLCSASSRSAWDPL